MAERPYPYWRAFLLTVAAFSTINAATLAYYLSLPIEPPGKGGGPPGRIAPRWVDAIMYVNLPGVVPVLAVYGKSDPLSETERVFRRALCLVSSPLIWGMIAVGVTRLERAVKRPVPNPDAPPESN